MTAAPDLADVLQQHLAGAPLDQTLAAIAHDDPRLQPLVQLLTERQAQLEDDLAQSEPEEDEDDQRRIADDQRRQAAMRLRKHVEALEDELARLRRVIESIGLALGACPACVGLEGACPVCHGGGHPGAVPPEQTTFDRLVLPAVRAQVHARARTERYGHDVPPAHNGRASGRDHQPKRREERP